MPRCNATDYDFDIYVDPSCLNGANTQDEEHANTCSEPSPHRLPQKDGQDKHSLKSLGAMKPTADAADHPEEAEKASVVASEEESLVDEGPRDEADSGELRRQPKPGLGDGDVDSYFPEEQEKEDGLDRAGDENEARLRRAERDDLPVQSDQIPLRLEDSAASVSEDEPTLDLATGAEEQPVASAVPSSLRSTINHKPSLRTEALIQAAARAVVAKMEKRRFEDKAAAERAKELAVEQGKKTEQPEEGDHPLRSNQGSGNKSGEDGSERQHPEHENEVLDQPPVSALSSSTHPSSLSADEEGCDSSSHHDDVFSDRGSARSSLGSPSSDQPGTKRAAADAEPFSPCYDEIDGKTTIRKTRTPSPTKAQRSVHSQLYESHRSSPTHLSHSKSRAPRVSNATSISALSRYREEDFDDAGSAFGAHDRDHEELLSEGFMPAETRSSRQALHPFRTPSAMREIQMSSPTASVFGGASPRSGTKRQTGGSSVHGGSGNFEERSKMSPFPTVSRVSSPRSTPGNRNGRSTPTRFSVRRREAPLVLLHVTLLPLRWPWGDVLAALDLVTDPGERGPKESAGVGGDGLSTGECGGLQRSHSSRCSAFHPSDRLRALRDAWRQLQDRVGDTLLERGVLLPHPQNDYEVLEERLLEALDLPLRRRARILECGHYLGPSNIEDCEDEAENETEGEDCGEVGASRRTSTASNKSKLRESGRHWCKTCRHDIRYESLGPGKVFRVKVYASNGLMRAGAWDACWKEMERVDIEVEPIVEPAMQSELERLATALTERAEEDEKILREAELAEEHRDRLGDDGGLDSSFLDAQFEHGQYHSSPPQTTAPSYPASPPIDHQEHIHVGVSPSRRREASANPHRMRGVELEGDEDDRLRPSLQTALVHTPMPEFLRENDFYRPANEEELRPEEPPHQQEPDPYATAHDESRERRGARQSRKSYRRDSSATASSSRRERSPSHSPRTSGNRDSRKGSYQNASLSELVVETTKVLMRDPRNVAIAVLCVFLAMLAARPPVPQHTILEFGSPMGYHRGQSGGGGGRFDDGPELPAQGRDRSAETAERQEAQQAQLISLAVQGLAQPQTEVRVPAIATEEEPGEQMQPQQRLELEGADAPMLAAVQQPLPEEVLAAVEDVMSPEVADEERRTMENEEAVLDNELSPEIDLAPSSPLEEGVASDDLDSTCAFEVDSELVVELGASISDMSLRSEEVVVEADELETPWDWEGHMTVSPPSCAMMTGAMDEDEDEVPSTSGGSSSSDGSISSSAEHFPTIARAPTATTITTTTTVTTTIPPASSTALAFDDGDYHHNLPVQNTDTTERSSKDSEEMERGDMETTSTASLADSSNSSNSEGLNDAGEILASVDSLGASGDLHNGHAISTTSIDSNAYSSTTSATDSLSTRIDTANIDLFASLPDTATAPSTPAADTATCPAPGAVDPCGLCQVFGAGQHLPTSDALAPAFAPAPASLSVVVETVTQTVTVEATAAASASAVAAW